MEPDRVRAVPGKANEEPAGRHWVLPLESIAAASEQHSTLARSLQQSKLQPYCWIYLLIIEQVRDALRSGLLVCSKWNSFLDEYTGTYWSNNKLHTWTSGKLLGIVLAFLRCGIVINPLLRSRAYGSWKSN